MAENTYTSQFSGAEIDEAVSKVLNGEVTGDTTYTPSADDDTVAVYQTPTAGALKNKKVTEVLDILLFPEYPASAGTLPVLEVVNSNQTLEVGTTITTSLGYKVTTAQKPCQYVKSDGKYVAYDYTYEEPTITATVTDSKTKAILGTLTRSTTNQQYKLIGVPEAMLSKGSYLYSNKGTASNIEPALIGEESVWFDNTDATITGVYYGGKKGKKDSNVCINSEGKLSTTIGGTYGTSISYNILTDTANTTDHAFSTLGTHSVELYIVSGAEYSVKLTATKYDAGSGKFIADSDLTTKLNALTATTSTTTFKDASGTTYSVTSYSINPSSITTGGKFQVYMSITKTK